MKTKGRRQNFHFQWLALAYKLRDFLRPRIQIPKETGIQNGFHVLDYGCGPGSYIVPLAGLVGPTGRVYALDVHPLAIQMVERLALKRGLTNITTIQSDCRTGLPDGSLDVVLLYDVFHHLGQPGIVLKELHRVLKPSGVLSVSDHHLREQEIVSGITKQGFFRLAEKGRKTYSFHKSA